MLRRAWETKKQVIEQLNKRILGEPEESVNEISKVEYDDNEWLVIKKDNEIDAEEQDYGTTAPTVRRSDRDRMRRKPYSPKARFRAGL